LKLSDSINKTPAEKGRALEDLYVQVPTGTCKGCTKCCSESVNVSFLEFANIINNGWNHFDETDRERIAKRVIRFKLLEWTQNLKCPFLGDDQRCEIYAVRPLPCRLFGTATKTAYERNYKQIEAQNLRFALWLKKETHNLLPVSVVRHKIDFCEDFVPIKAFDHQSIDALYGKLINLDGSLFFEGIIDDTLMNGDLVSWMVQYLIETSTEDEEKVQWFRELFTDMRLACLSQIQK